jgi:hypothetical protein
LRDKEPFYRRGGIKKERVIVPVAGRRDWMVGVAVPTLRRRSLFHLKMDENFSMFPVSENGCGPMEKTPSPHPKINRKMVCLYKTPFFDFPMASPWVFQCIPQLKIET